ncbi:DNA-entry nuclease [Paenibacillus mucilaginosus]|uniref:NucA/NucB deoxyribonuclease domain-containing protein n=1 Tax=Paenibacillus mucilaginosus TaxID=61624 RepID=UPI0002FA8482|nr:NucA/NucB deoxyribonuclease domain-containing protein [Paenibacillus mucilaginosus]WFA19292.1 DNA-entry nuclease [Paenibacillus mucilaginosus]
MKKVRLIVQMIFFLILAIVVFQVLGEQDTQQPDGVDYTLILPADRYPETLKHIREAIAEGESAVCTIDREGAEENRKESLKGIPTKKGYDRDEWPMAMCAEGGTGADVEYVPFADNRGAGSWIGNQLERFPDGSRILFQLP